MRFDSTLVKMNHGEENCSEHSNMVHSGQHPNMTIIFINAFLEASIRIMINQLINQYPLEEDEEEPNNYIQCIMMCPVCGTPFSHQ